jgi:hypothetical protein
MRHETWEGGKREGGRTERKEEVCLALLVSPFDAIAVHIHGKRGN